MKPIYFLFFLFSINPNLFSQSKKIIYVDESFRKINFDTYSHRMKSDLFLTYFVENDTTIFKKLRFKEYYGNLGKKKSQLNKLYHHRNDIDSTKIWLIHYIDSLPDVTKMPKESGSYYELIDSNGRKILINNSEYDSLYTKQLRKFPSRDSIIYKGKTVVLARRHIHISNYSDYKKSISKEIDKISKHKKVSLFHFYNTNKGYPVDEIKFFWIKDENEILKNSFSDGQLQYKFLLIYQNGDFYAGHYFKLPSEQKKLLKYKLFKKMEKKWLKRLNKLN